MINAVCIDAEGNMRGLGIQTGTKEEVESALKEAGWTIVQIYETDDHS